MAIKRVCFWTSAEAAQDSEVQQDRPTSVFLSLCSRSVASEHLNSCSEHQCVQCLQVYDGCS